MFLVNRAVLIVKPKQPFLDWANATDGPEFDPEHAFPFLVSELPDSKVDTLIKKHYREIFEEALNSWVTDETAWPADRGLKTFREWFTVEYHDFVVDLCDQPLQIEEL
jgi:hypothetical protein